MPSPENSGDQREIPPRHNSPTGWAAFRALRQRPAPVPRRRHGNRKHGNYTQSARASMALIRFCARALRTGRGDLSTFYGRQPVAPGWRVFRKGQSGGRL
jgi:hypothetical protein